jgi:hypothetical protein
MAVCLENHLLSLAASGNQARFVSGRAPGRQQIPGGLKIALLDLSKGLLTHGIIVLGCGAAVPFQDEGAQCLEGTLHILVSGHSLRRSRYSPGQLALPAMREGAVLDRLTAGQCIGRKVLRAQIGADLAVAANH